MDKARLKIDGVSVSYDASVAADVYETITAVIRKGTPRNLVIAGEADGVETRTVIHLTSTSRVSLVVPAAAVDATVFADNLADLFREYVQEKPGE